MMDIFEELPPWPPWPQGPAARDANLLYTNWSPKDRSTHLTAVLQSKGIDARPLQAIACPESRPLDFAMLYCTAYRPEELYYLFSKQ